LSGFRSKTNNFQRLTEFFYPSQAHSMKKIAFMLFLLGYSGLASADFQSAMRAIERGHYATAERALRKPAALGEARAQNNLGYLYEHGLGVTQNYVEARNWYSKAAAGGLAEAKFNLATLYHHGRGISQNAELAAPLFSSAAQSGYAEAEYMVGEYHRTGMGGLKKDGAVALAWFLRASRKGHSGAQLMAASIYLSGEGWRSEPRKALVWGELARINGETQAQAIVSRAGKGLGAELLQEAMQQASVCLQTDYRDCPE
jgi:TPR repeat protein